MLVRHENRAVDKATGDYNPGYLELGKSGDRRRAWCLSPKIAIICCSGFNFKLYIYLQPNYWKDVEFNKGKVLDTVRQWNMTVVSLALPQVCLWTFAGYCLLEKGYLLCGDDAKYHHDCLQKWRSAGTSKKCALENIQVTDGQSCLQTLSSPNSLSSRMFNWNVYA